MLLDTHQNPAVLFEKCSPREGTETRYITDRSVLQHVHLRNAVPARGRKRVATGFVDHDVSIYLRNAVPARGRKPASLLFNRFFLGKI